MDTVITDHAQTRCSTKTCTTMTRGACLSVLLAQERCFERGGGRLQAGVAYALCLSGRQADFGHFVKGIYNAHRRRMHIETNAHRTNIAEHETCMSLT